MKRYELVVSGGLFTYGLYLATPLYVLSEPATLARGASAASVMLAGAVYVIGSIPSLAGILFNHMGLRKFGVLMTGCTWIFAAIMRISAVGVHSALWGFMLLLAATSFIIRLDITTFQRR